MKKKDVEKLKAIIGEEMYMMELRKFTPDYTVPSQNEEGNPRIAKEHLEELQQRTDYNQRNNITTLIAECRAELQDYKKIIHKQDKKISKLEFEVYKLNDEIKRNRKNDEHTIAKIEKDVGCLYDIIQYISIFAHPSFAACSKKQLKKAWKSAVKCRKSDDQKYL